MARKARPHPLTTADDQALLPTAPTGGRPTKRTEAVEQSLLELLRAGNTQKDAAEYLGIDRRTIQRWMRDTAFAARVRRAEVAAVIRHVTIVSTAKSWQAHAWMLERRRPQDWGRLDRVAYQQTEAPVDAAQAGEVLIIDVAAEPG